MENRTFNPEEDITPAGAKTIKGVVTEKCEIEKVENKLQALGKDMVFKETPHAVLDKESLTKRKIILANIVGKAEELTLKV